MSQLYDESQACITDHANWSPQAYRDLIRRLAERNRELEGMIEDCEFSKTEEVA